MQISWATKNKGFFKGDGERTITRFERDALVAICAITAFIALIRLYQWTEYLNR